jgi:Rap1a immunity proteins
MRALLSLVLMAVMIAPGAAGEPDHSANRYLPACRNYVNRQFAINPFDQGKCVGILQGLVMLSRELDPKKYEVGRTCPPGDVTLGQMTAVVVRWLDQRPQEWHEDFGALALNALHDAWPCK